MGSKAASGKVVSTVIRLLIPAGGAKPGPPVGPALGQHGLNLMAFCKEFNARTQHLKPDVPVPVKLTAYTVRASSRPPSPPFRGREDAGAVRESVGTGREGGE